MHKPHFASPLKGVPICLGVQLPSRLHSVLTPSFKRKVQGHVTFWFSILPHKLAMPSTSHVTANPCNF